MKATGLFFGMLVLAATSAGSVFGADQTVPTRVVVLKFDYRDEHEIAAFLIQDDQKALGGRKCDLAAVVPSDPNQLAGYLEQHCPAKEVNDLAKGRKLYYQTQARRYIAVDEFVLTGSLGIISATVHSTLSLDDLSIVPVTFAYVIEPTEGNNQLSADRFTMIRLAETTLNLAPIPTKATILP